MKVLIKNFQNISEVKLDVRGLTMLIGQSSNGKSATLRALQASCLNRFAKGQVKHGEKQAEVYLEPEDGYSLWYVKPENGSMAIKMGTPSGEKTFTKLSRTVPLEVSQLLNVDSITSDTTNYNLNFHPQFEKPLLMEFSQRKVMELLSASPALDDYNLLKSEISTVRAENKGAFRSLDSILTALKTEHSELQSKVDARQHIVESIKEYKTQLEALNKDYERVSMLDGIITSLNPINAKIGLINKIGVLCTDAHGLAKRLNGYNTLMSIDIPTMERRCGITMKVVHLAESCKCGELLLTKVNNLLNCSVPSIPNLLIQRIQSLTGVVEKSKECHSIDATLAKYVMLTDKQILLTRMSDRCKELEDVLYHNICPICKAKITLNHTHNE